MSVVATETLCRGIEIDEEKLLEAVKIGPTWSNPIWRLEGGSFAEW